MSFHVMLSQSLWKRHLTQESVVVDATLGNGRDFLFLAKLLFPSSKAFLYGIDIQKEAIEASQKRLYPYFSEEKNIYYYLQSHEDLSFLSKPVDLFVYNLGYLPGGDKNLTTQVGSTLVSLKKALSLLNPKGAISVMLYPGHSVGKKEKEALLHFFQNLPSSEFYVSHHTCLQTDIAPSLIWAYRR